MNWLKNLWANWKVQISIVGGALVIATTYATCTVDPDVDAIQDAVEDAAGEVEGAEPAAVINTEITETIENAEVVNSAENTENTD